MAKSLAVIERPELAVKELREAKVAQTLASIACR